MSFSFSETDISEMKELDFSIVLENYGIEIEKNKKLLCPFHNDHSPSMILNDKKNRCECYVCHKKWDTIAFVEDIDNLSFPDAMLKLIKISGGDIQKYSQTPKISYSNLRRLRKEEKVLLEMVNDEFSIYPKKPIGKWSIKREERGETVPNYNNDSDTSFYDGYLILEKSKFTENYLFENYPDVYRNLVLNKITVVMDKIRKKYESGDRTEDMRKNIEILNKLVSDFEYYNEKAQ